MQQYNKAFTSKQVGQARDQTQQRQNFASTG
uniref:Uncharacterized protein n=1 Tax=Arundo donax TaxID=35708 RepID=A0A0A9FYX5_ARUDO